MTKQVCKSQYGRKGITVSAACPTVAIAQKLGRVHVGTPAAEVEDMVREAVAAQRAAGNAAWTESFEREAIRYALWRHAENGAEYAWVMGSH